MQILSKKVIEIFRANYFYAVAFNVSWERASSIWRLLENSQVKWSKYLVKLQTVRVSYSDGEIR